MDKSGIKNFAIEARKVLRESAIKKAGYYGITIDNISEPVQKLTDSQVFKTIAGDEIRLYKDDLKKRNNLIAAINNLGFEQVIEETAYTWFNRLIAIRFMEINDYLPSRVRVLSSEAGGSTPDIVRDVMELDLNLSQAELDNIRKAKDENRYDDAFQMLFIKQCNELNAVLPGLFEKTDDYMELLLDLSYTGDGVVRMLTTMIPEDDFNVEKEGQIEIIGWLYQYYNTELKDDTFAKLKKNIKITKERIPAATQLFTPDWIVRYMVENSLGRVWIEHLRSVNPLVDEKAKAEEFGWKYYLPEAEQEDSVAAELVKIRAEYKDMRPQEILCIDPCSGSGHILVYMFDVLLQIYESEGISERDAAFEILENNIFGLDIDKRAYQLSYFALMMKGRGVAGRRFFRGVETEDGDYRPIHLNVYVIDESNGIDKNVLDSYGVSMPLDDREKAKGQVENLLAEMHDAKEYGSIINVTDFDMDLMKRYLSDRDEKGQLSLLQMDASLVAEKIWNLAKIGKLLAQKYDAVITNPPYMNSSNMNSMLVSYTKKVYGKYNLDLFSVFIIKCTAILKNCGYESFLSPYVWMFIQAYEDLRNYIYCNSTMQSLVQFEYSAFEEATVPICTFTLNGHLEKYNSTFVRLTDFRGGMDKQKQKFLEATDNKNCGYIYYINSQKFEAITGRPVAYWLSDALFNIFKSSKKVGEIALPKQGSTLGDNASFLRLWTEIADRKFKWYTCVKGGPYRKWYGNLNYVVNWENNGSSVKSTGRATIRSEAMLFKEGITWSNITSGKSSFRYMPPNCFFESSGTVCFIENEKRKYLLGFLNSNIVEMINGALNPTLHLQSGDVAKIPFVYDDNVKESIDKLVEENVSISKDDWDSFEFSWDFRKHPLLPNISNFFSIEEDGVKESGLYMEATYDTWKNVCDSNFNCLKQNEEKLNRIFVGIYGLQGELSSDVADKDVTVRRIFDTKDDIPDTMKNSNYAITKRDAIVSFLSYAVGCMFGRYSLDEEGLVYVCGEFDKNKYKTFPADDDAIIPITDEEYFEDDIVKRFVEFVSVVYGRDTLEENLDFIADALDGKGSTSREIIRNYFLNDFFKDHAKTYSVTGSGKRPIYWLFDSGKQNGFKCLIYMHRYTPDTVGLIRSVYLKKASDAIQKALDNAEYIIANTESNVDRAMATKKRDKYVKQLAEIKPYYQALSHVAMQRIELDLDDGVKVNYAKFQGIEVGGDGEKKQTINLLAKI